MFNTRNILFWSQNPDELVKFYQDVLELEQVSKTDIPAQNGLEKDYGYTLKISENNNLWIGHHSEITGQNKDPMRRMINLNTDEVQKWFEKVKAAGCKIIQEPILTPFATEENPIYVCTWLDPDGNCWQFMGKL
ncbi:VOC family protein [Candidatus Dojkabacteria bacterium]|uniref:VOC family protein n=1 Tax=Candidatus Dojkabacteria bacterium TaxID=2099670 RepID=A0A955L115_9BACT|nr:VOC family protein [Candidatus Dojkabacteria bacterium]